jgi:hypothetical protein
MLRQKVGDKFYDLTDNWWVLLSPAAIHMITICLMK